MLPVLAVDCMLDIINYCKEKYLHCIYMFHLNIFSIYGHISPAQWPDPLTRGDEFYKCGSGLYEHQINAYTSFQHVSE